MTTRPKPEAPVPAPPRLPAMRRVPSQKRALDRVNRILTVATRLIVERGLDAVRMSDVAEQAEISIGSLYQYFPDKAAIVVALIEHYNAEGRACVAAEFATVAKRADLRPALERAIDGFYDMYRRHPAMRALWQAMQADITLQAIDAEDCAAHARMLTETLVRIDPTGNRARQELLGALLVNLLAAAVRFAITLDPRTGDAALALFKNTLPKDLAALTRD